MSTFPLLPGDLAVFHAVNGLAGSFVLDHLVKQAEENALLRGALFLTAYWFLWFKPSPSLAERRKTLIVLLVAVIASVVAARMLAIVLPFRTRPMYTAGIGFHPTAFPVSFQLVNWSSFPSDTAAYFFAMAAGVWALSRTLSVVGMIYTAVYICLPRLYLGLHWPSDLVVGCAIGAVIPALVLRSNLARRAIAAPLLICAERYPQYFYGGLFLLTAEMVPTFNDERILVDGIAMIAHHFGWPALSLLAPVGLCGLAAIGGLAYAVHRVAAGGARELRRPQARPAAPSRGAVLRNFEERAR